MQRQEQHERLPLEGHHVANFRLLIQVKLDGVYAQEGLPPHSEAYGVCVCVYVCVFACVCDDLCGLQLHGVCMT